MPLPVDRLLSVIIVLFASLAVALRPLMPGHRVEGNLWVEMCVFIAFMALVVRMAMGRRLRIARTGMGIPALLLLGLAVVSTCRSPYLIGSLGRLFEWLSYAAIYFVLVDAVSEGGLDRRFFLRLLWASAFVVALYGLFQQFVDMPLLARQIAAAPERVQLELRMNARHMGDLMARATGRIFSTFLVSNSFAGFLALVVPGFVGYVLDRVRAGDRGRLFLAASGLWVAAALACLVLTFSKGGWVAFLVGSAAFCAMLGKAQLRRHARLLVGAVAGAAVAAALLFVLGVIPVQIFRDAWPSLAVRLGYWHGALAMARQHPLGGVGLDAFGVFYPLYRPLLAHVAQAAHNDYLQVLAELGVPGLLAFLWLWFAYLRNAFWVAPSNLFEGAAGAGASKTPSNKFEGATPGRGRFPPRIGYAAGLLALVFASVTMAMFTLSGWWDAAPASLEAKVWLDRALAAAFAAAWVFFFAALGRGERWPPGELCRKGLVCGMIAFLVHCAVDFDYREPGVALAAWVVAALSVAPRRPAAERRLGPAAALAVGACVLLAMGAFQLVLTRGTRAATDREVGAGLVSEAARAPSPLRRTQLLREALERYERAVAANPLDDELCTEYGDLFVSFLVEPGAATEGGQLRLRLLSLQETSDFRRAVALYQRAARLNPVEARAHVRLARLFMAAADANARGVLEPFADACAALRAASGAGRLYLPAVVEAEEALARDPNNPTLLLVLAETLARHGDPAAARETARRALKLDTLLFDEQPGHKMCLSFEDRARVHALLERLGAKPARS